MACFPRRFLRRHKNSFTPAQDDNVDTILYNRDSTVQIGRYIRREESSLFTPKPSKNQLRQRKVPSYFDDCHENVLNNNNNNNKSENNVANKKFIANKTRTMANSNSAAGVAKDGNAATNFTPNLTSAKLKPVKGRRPTALPTEALKIADDDDDHDHDEGSDERDNEDGGHEWLNGFAEHRTELKSRTPQNPQVPIGPHTKRTVREDHYDTEDSTNRRSQLTKASLRPAENAEILKLRHSPLLSAVASKGSIASNYSLSRLTPKFPSTSSNRLRKIGRVDTPISTSLSSFLGDEVHTPSTPTPPPPPPPPPPLPPLSLTVAASPKISLVSHKSSKCQCNARFSSNRSSHTAALAETETERETEKGTETKVKTPTRFDVVDDYANPPVHLQPLPDATYRNRDVRTGGSHEGSNSSSSRGTTETASYSPSYLRDSGVQVEDSASSPEDSSTGGDMPHWHRPEGGLIFTRTKLPFKKDVKIEFFPKDEATRNLIRKAIEQNDFLNNYMDKERKELVINAMTVAHFRRNSFIINENDEGSEIYVSEEGHFDVIKAGRLIGNFGPATVFGELAILYNAKRFASIKAATNARVWKIDRDTFRKIMVISGSKEREENLNFLRSAPFLNDLSEEVLNKVVDLLQRKFYETHSCIVREGEVGNEFFIIRGGTVTIKKKNARGEERVVDRRKRGDYFGEQALLNADCRQASVYADPPGTEVLKLDREAFISYLGTIPQLRELPTERANSEIRDSSRQSDLDNEYAHIELRELKRIATLGAGAFGRVDLVAYGEKTFALKIIKKVDVVKQDQIEHVYSEKYVMTKCRSCPFVIELYKTFRNEKFVYFLMEACMGGDVWTIMSQRRFFDEKTARFIAGCVVEAFDFLHSHNIIYRDLKPENLMLTTDGYCKLVDFGFAKHIPPNQKTNTFAGTPEYVAPEIILDRGHDRSVDYWALGILIFELLVGKTPFRGHNQIKIYQQILGGIDVVQMPSKIPKSAQGLIRQLCKQLPAERLGYQRKGILDIKRHSWFDGFDWQKLKNKQLISPIQRPIASSTDTQHFGPAGVENDHDPPDEVSGWDIDF